MNRSITYQMNEILSEITENIENQIDAALATIPKKAAADLRNSSPRNTGEYAKGWRVSRSRKVKCATVVNSKKPTLTHLIENGHAIVNQYGRHGRINGNHLIENTAQKRVADFTKALTDDLKL